MKEDKKKMNTVNSDIRNAVQQFRPNNKQETIMKPASKKEVKEAVRRLNPDDGTRHRG